jgi:hypothetical protein
MSETRILIRLLRIYFPRISEFGPASEFRRGFEPPKSHPLGTPLVHCFEIWNEFILKLLFIVGLDIAWAENGYVYHTSFDDVDQIPLGSLQRTGDNVLALILALVNNDKMANVEKYASGNLVFFDILGAFVIHWCEQMGLVINTVALAVSVYCLFRNMKASTTRGKMP